MIIEETNKVYDILKKEAIMYDEYGIRVFGQKIEEHGSGGTQKDFGKYKYEFIDCSYLKLLMKYGIVSSIVVAVVSLGYTHMLYDREKYKTMVIFLVIIVNSMIAHHYIEITYNFMIPILLCNYKHSREYELEDENE